MPSFNLFVAFSLITHGTPYSLAIIEAWLVLPPMSQIIADTLLMICITCLSAYLITKTSSVPTSLISSEFNATLTVPPLTPGLAPSPLISCFLVPLLIAFFFIFLSFPFHKFIEIKMPLFR